MQITIYNTFLTVQITIYNTFLTVQITIYNTFLTVQITIEHHLEITRHMVIWALFMKIEYSLDCANLKIIISPRVYLNNNLILYVSCKQQSNTINLDDANNINLTHEI